MASHRTLVKHVQQQLFRPHGGRRPGAGRPPTGKRAGSRHKKRPTLKGRYPVHVVLRVMAELGNLRRRDVYRAVRGATITAAASPGPGDVFHIVHVSIQRSHLHLLVEAANKTALSRGMQSFQISAAKLINATIKDASGKRRRGQVFADRYHQEIIESPRQARHSLAYVLNNWRKHREDQVGAARSWKVDPFSTGALFGGWKDLEGGPGTDHDSHDPMAVWSPRTWLLAEGWRRHGLIRTTEVPSAGRR